MLTCVMKCCKNNNGFHRKSDGITFHMFPRDLKWKEQWIRIVRLERKEENWQPLKSSAICSSHFDKCDMYETINDNRRLKRYCLPKKIFLINSVWCEENKLPDNETASTPRLDVEESKTDMETSPVKYYEEQNILLRKKNKQLQLLARRNLATIQSLTKKNLRVEGRNKYLQDIVKVLKKKVNAMAEESENYPNTIKLIIEDKTTDKYG